MKDKNSYSSIFKAIGLFGGAKIIHILVGIVRNKIVAILLGPTGMGINGLIISNTQLIRSFTDFGLQTSAVRDIAKAGETGNQERIDIVSSVLRKLVLITGLLGTVVTILLARHLSIWSFGNEDYTNAFRIVSVVLLFDQLFTGNNALLQGTFHYKYIAKTSVVGSLLGLFVSIPMYYLWGEQAIVPVIIVCSFLSYFLTVIYVRKIGLKKRKLSLKEIIYEGRPMIVLGVAVALSGIMRNGSTYLTRLFVSNYGTLADVGLFVAGISISTQYIEVVLSAMGSDYAPRLSAISSDRDSFIEVMNKQTKLVLTIISPLILFFIVFIKELTTLLYSTKFLEITGMIEWMMVGMMLRAISFCLSYSIIAMGDGKTFFWNELVSMVYNIILIIVGYKFWRFNGVGIAFCLSYLLYAIQVFIVCKSKYNFSYNKENIRLISIHLSYVLVLFITLQLLGYSIARYIVGTVALALSLVYTYRKLNEMMPLREAVTNYIRNKRRV